MVRKETSFSVQNDSECINSDNNDITDLLKEIEEEIAYVDTGTRVVVKRISDMST